MSDKLTRRRFVKYGLVTVATFIGTVATITVDKSTGFKIGQNKVKFGMAEANATCGTSYDCTGGGGECGTSYGCAGGGGECGTSYSCSGGGRNDDDYGGGGGECGTSYSCAGGGGECGTSYSCAGGGGECGTSYNCAGK